MTARTASTATLDLEAAREKYRHERDRRLRRDGAGQYTRAAGEFGYYAKDPYTEHVEREPVEDRVEVLVIGAGFGGLLTAARLREAGVESIRLMDEAGDVGGTWYWNRYPGVRCDIESYVYMPLLEEVGTMPSERYAPGEEIRRHSVAIAEHYGLYRDALFQTRATSLEWDEECDEWIVGTDRGDRFRARFVVTSSGTMTQAKLPGIPGIENFRGHTFHTSRWDYGYTGGSADGGLTGLADKRVAVVGTGATGLQVVPHVGADARELVVFQRTPSTVDVRDNRPTDPEWAASLQPGWQRERMENFLAVLAGEPVAESLVQDGWTATTALQRQILTGAVDESLSLEERERRDELDDLATMNRLRARIDEVVEDRATAEALKPWYRYMCKRPGFSDTYLPAFNRSNVTLVDTADAGGITRVTETSVFVGDAEYEVDCLIFATGFEVGISGVMSGTLPVTGRGGRTLLEAWARGPRTLHGFSSHGFPNLFHLSGIQNANSVNFAHILLEQAEHIAAVIARGREVGARYLEPSAEAEEAWVRTVHETASDTRAFQAECTPGYYNGEGTRSIAGAAYSPGPIAFHRLLREWREDGMRDVLVGATVGASR
ncbi:MULTISPECIES: NAD(P)/FAD-dependent oxidoreductase [unclassified Rathayibacter]|uniref:flavin-containing monooxygenase n=1 Tax=unclassified Rathayibacter TaxID=2609250 RepID=UPI00104EE0FC|nr:MULTISPECIES: NAD(P)/FAD-dependent oxidoreductase [unclassified Rathayibacter]TCL83092.1 cation diffusion facilitator CzcD-associated flavoprotein CzcO [Rathayibacter sp. PhB192]TCM28590.1 cation diffusion facilitator CzcD-associated flavoprotein CzcO [Rathayibacter sp. PhB179]